MPAKRQIKITRKSKETKSETTKTTEKKTPVTTVAKKNESDVKATELNNVKVSWEIVWNWTKTIVQQPKWRIKFEAAVAPVPMFKLPADIRQYLINKWFGTNVWRKDKEWLEKHWADMEMIEKLKKFLTGLDY